MSAGSVTAARHDFHRAGGGATPTSALQKSQPFVRFVFGQTLRKARRRSQADRSGSQASLRLLPGQIVARQTQGPCAALPN